MPIMVFYEEMVKDCVANGQYDVSTMGSISNVGLMAQKAGEADNKASHFYVAQYWADALANGKNAELAEKFAPVAQALKDNEATIIEELLSVEGKAQDIGGYYNPNEELAEKAMRPSATLNGIIDAI